MNRTPPTLEQHTELGRRLQSELDSERRIGELKDIQIAMLRMVLDRADRPAPIPDDMWRTLAGLVHPDRHNGSSAATRAMAWLNAQRRYDS